VLLPGTSLEDAVAILDRLRAATPLGQSFSAGAALWETNETSEQVVARADRALYQAKEAGRNRILVAGTAAGPSPLRPTPAQAGARQGG
jgi:GGDEF domain-containing protein